MSYFNHAFKKSFLVVKGANEESTQQLTAGQAGTYNKFWKAKDIDDAFVQSGPGYFAVGSLHLEPGANVLTSSKDSIGNNPGHGGYTESSKTKGINARYISGLRITEIDQGALPSAQITVGNKCAPCGENLFIRMDVKGSPALRFLNHNAYAIGDSSGDAAAGDVPSLCCNPGTGTPGSEQEYLDPAVALASAASMLLADPLISPFVKEDPSGGIVVVTTANPGGVVYTIAEILDGTSYTPTESPESDPLMTATLKVVSGYVDSKFGNCSFDTRDHYELEPISIIMSVLDETGDPCNDCGVFLGTPGRMSTTSGETVLRELVMTERYGQNPLSQGAKDSSRIREIEHSSDIINAIDRNALYKVYTLQHSVPRFNNPTGVFDNDQYVYNFFTLPGTDGDSFMNAKFDELAEEMQNANIPVSIERYSCAGSKEEDGGGK
jgi:hypothetical protein